MRAILGTGRGGRWWRALAVAVGVVVTAASSTGVATGVTSAPQPTCQQGSNGVLFVTPGCQDPALTQPYSDVDEQRTTTDPRHT